MWLFKEPDIHDTESFRKWKGWIASRVEEEENILKNSMVQQLPIITRPCSAINKILLSSDLFSILSLSGYCYVSRDGGMRWKKCYVTIKPFTIILKENDSDTNSKNHEFYYSTIFSTKLLVLPKEMRFQMVDSETKIEYPTFKIFRIYPENDPTIDIHFKDEEETVQWSEACSIFWKVAFMKNEIENKEKASEQHTQYTLQQHNLWLERYYLFTKQLWKLTSAQPEWVNKIKQDTAKLILTNEKAVTNPETNVNTQEVQSSNVLQLTHSESSRYTPPLRRRRDMFSFSSSPIIPSVPSMTSPPMSGASTPSSTPGTPTMTHRIPKLERKTAGSKRLLGYIPVTKSNNDLSSFVSSPNSSQPTLRSSPSSKSLVELSQIERTTSDHLPKDQIQQTTSTITPSPSPSLSEICIVFVLYTTFISIEDEKNRNVLAFVILKFCSFYDHPDNSSFTLCSPRGNFTISFRSEDEKQDWMKVIKECVLYPLQMDEEGKMSLQSVNVYSKKLLLHATSSKKLHMPKYTYSKSLIGRMSLTLNGATEYHLKDEGPWRIGKFKANEVVIPVDDIVYCKIELVNNVPMIEDLDSFSGTFVNSRKLTDPFPLAPGDLIKLGNYILVFNVKGASKIFKRCK
eukprot:TRINITY_DN4351_c0_g1_i2.p1 TRINITY_DN4351_c0_g1~~TRINITY_DN4351_c0_g1_i2.p1  ORF type:complete len:628 (-),score=75.86 TRINITY_DN4351_c0_g1_i2:4-1887(-)